MKKALLAGLIGGIVGSLLTLPAFLIYLLPIELGLTITLCACIPYMLLYPGVGVLAAYWLTPPRSLQQGAIAGTLAGSVAFFIDGVFTFIVALLFVLSGVYEQSMLDLFPNSWLYTPGLELLTSPTGMLIITFSTVIFNIVIGTLMGALGGLVYAAMKPDA